jgi:hypothetical protein
MKKLTNIQNHLKNKKINQNNKKISILLEKGKLMGSYTIKFID